MDTEGLLALDLPAIKNSTNTINRGERMGIRKPIHERVLNASCKQELKAAYRDWAERYDTDLVDEMGYVAPKVASDLLLKYLNDPNARILDAGCGTGLVGSIMHKCGYTNIEGVDYSPDMLEQAAEKGIYRALIEADLTNALNIADRQYDAVISVGTFTCGHVGPQALDELVRITKKGGYICFTVREQAWEEDRYIPKIEAMTAAGAWEMKEMHTADYIRQEGASCKACLYRITQ